MKKPNTLAVLFALVAGLSAGSAQTTSINYQGSLSESGVPSQGSYEFEIELFDAVADGTSVAGPLTRSSVSVSSGLFSTELDFGGTAFDGSDRWLEIRVHPQGSTDAYVTLSPRQSITSAPYALRSLSADQAFTATSAASAITATTAASVAVGGVDAAALQEGSVGTSSVSNDSLQPEDLNVGSFDLTFWKLGGNLGVTPGVHFVGTTDDQPLEFRVNSEHALRVESTAGTPNLVGGFAGNTSGLNTEGVTIGGGGETDAANMVSDESNYVVIAGGLKNTSNAGARATTIGGGEGNQISEEYGTISGGLDNNISGVGSTIGGGIENVVEPENSLVSGGILNRVLGISTHSTIGGGGNNTIQSGSRYATIGGGRLNSVLAGSVLATIGGGERNVIRYAAPRASIGAGFVNLIHDRAVGSRIGGGFMNTISTNSFYSTISGGTENLIETNVFGAFIGGGQANMVESNAQHATVSGGEANRASGLWSAVPGGRLNVSEGDYSFAAGHRAQALDDGSFVWADSTDEDFSSTANDQFLIRATGGVAIGTNDPAGAALRVVGDIKANNFIGMGSTMMLGTSDDQPLEFKVNGERALRIEHPGSVIAPNLIGGSFVNYVEDGVTGSTIGGGGAPNVFGTPGTNTIHGDFGTIGGGAGNTIVLGARYATIGGGFGNSLGNVAHSTTIPGGQGNTIGAFATGATIGGGKDNLIFGQSHFSTIAGGTTNFIAAETPLLNH